MVDWQVLLERLLVERFSLFIAILALLLGVLFGYLAARLVRRILVDVGLADAVEGTPFERSVRGLGTSTISILSTLSGLFVFATAVILALRILGWLSTQLLVERVTDYFPSLFIAALAIVFGLVLGDKAAIVVGERLRSVKLPETGVIPTLTKYSIIYVAALIALAQLGVSVAALLVLLAAYAFGIVFIGGLAFRDLLAASATGMYLLLNQPYSIGDEVRIDGNRGIVQEVDMFVTRIENDGEEFVVPNHRIMRDGIVRIRRD